MEYSLCDKFIIEIQTMRLKKLLKWRSYLLILVEAVKQVFGYDVEIYMFGSAIERRLAVDIKGFGKPRLSKAGSQAFRPPVSTAFWAQALDEPSGGRFPPSTLASIKLEDNPVRRGNARDPSSGNPAHIGRG